MKKALKWRLSKLPTPQEVINLVIDKIITQEEARSIFFSETEENERDVESLKLEIKFLRELVGKLSNRTQIIETVKEIKVPYYQKPWFEPYQWWCNPASVSDPINYTTMSGSFVDVQTF